jgi:hypothetical protein
MSGDSSPICVLVVDDHQLIRVGIATPLQKFAVDFAPAGIFGGHSLDEAPDFQRHFGPPATRPGTPAGLERRAMPGDHGPGFHDDQSVRPSQPNPRQKDPETRALHAMEARSVVGQNAVGGVSYCTSSCQSYRADTAPSIEFSSIPPAAQGGRERVETIAERVQNPRPGQQIVIYARSGTWWMQPWPPYLGS